VRRRIGGVPLGLLICCTLVALIILVPVVFTVVQGASDGWSAAWASIRTSSSLTLLGHTLAVTVAATPMCAVLGVGTAWFTERTHLPLRRLWQMLVVAPLVVPVFVTSYAWANLGSWSQGFIGAWGVVTFSYFPIVFLLVAASLRVVDPTLEESARSLGLGTWSTFRRVVLPQLRPALLGGLLLVTLGALVEFDAFVALSYQTFTITIYAQYQISFNASGAAALSFYAIALCLVILLAESRLRGTADYARLSQGARRGIARYPLGRTTPLVLAAFAIIAAVSIGIPIGTLLYWFTQSSSAALASASATLQYLWPATLTSLLLGLASALVALLLALPIAVMATRYKGPLSTVLERSVYLSFALPDLVAALALAYAASHYAHALYGSVTLFVLAEAMLFVPFAVVALRSTLGLIEPALEESSRSSGLGPLRTFWRVTLPLARPGLAAAGVLVFALALSDLSTAQVLLPPGMYTLGTQFWANSRTVAFAAAAPYGALLVGLAFAATVVLGTRFGRVRSLEAT
jgi:iron(III) transport system permease protein